MRSIFAAFVVSAIGLAGCSTQDKPKPIELASNTPHGADAVFGTVVMPNGSPRENVAFYLAPLTPKNLSSEHTEVFNQPALARTSADGSFLITGVKPGQYQILYRRQEPNGALTTTSMPIKVPLKAKNGLQIVW